MFELIRDDIVLIKIELTNYQIWQHYTFRQVNDFSKALHIANERQKNITQVHLVPMHTWSQTNKRNRLKHTLTV